jgi:hypothetical protein
MKSQHPLIPNNAGEGAAAAAAFLYWSLKVVDGNDVLFGGSPRPDALGKMMHVWSGKRDRRDLRRFFAERLGGAGPCVNHAKCIFIRARRRLALAVPFPRCGGVAPPPPSRPRANQMFDCRALETAIRLGPGVGGGGAGPPTRESRA